MSETKNESIPGLNDAVDFFRQEAKTKSNGILEVPKGAFVKAMEKQGVTEEEMKKVQGAVDFVTTAAAGLATSSLEEKIEQASKEELADEAFRLNLKSTVRIPTFGGSTEVTTYAETHNPIPTRGDADGNGERQIKITHGRVKTTVNAKGRIIGNYAEDIRNSIRTKLGAKD
jgi:hypothetical protein